MSKDIFPKRAEGTSVPATSVHSVGHNCSKDPVVRPLK